MFTNIVIGKKHCALQHLKLEETIWMKNWINLVSFIKNRNLCKLI